jgi:glycosyltransferase involved in cell wall biosynthesis/predicted O-methyltransferase YrrM
MPLTTTPDATWSLYDYTSPGLLVVRPDEAFPHMREGDPLHHPWKYLRRDVPHRWYVDERFPLMGFLNRDEAVLLHNIALQFAGKRALEIGSWAGWSTCHLALAGVQLDVIDPAHDDPVIRASVEDSLRRCGVAERVRLARGRSPENIAEMNGRWSLFFIDGDHESPAPVRDTEAALSYANYDCAFVFHDLASPAVAEPLRFLREKGFQVVVYQTAQIMAMAWRGDVQPVAHVPDPNVAWQVPPHLAGLPIAGVDAQLPSRPEYPALRDRVYRKPASRPSVCIVTSELIGPFKNGGVGTSMTGLAKLLADDGLEVTVLYTGAVWAPEVRLGPWVKHYAARGIDLVPLSLERANAIEGPLKELGLIAPWLVYEELRARRFDVIHFNDCCGQGSLCLAAKALGLAFGESLLSVALHSPSSWVYDLNHFLPASRACAAFDYSERLSIACADLLWSPSRYLLDWIGERGFQLPPQTFVQQYVLPREKHDERPPAGRRGRQHWSPKAERTPLAASAVHAHTSAAGHAGPPEAPRRSSPVKELVFFGRLEERKGLRLFCNAVQQLAPELERRGIRVTFLGKPVECAGMPSGDYIAKRAAAWRFPVQTLTDLGQPEALRYLQEGGDKLAVMPSPFDNSPCTVYEALAAGIPFLAARTGGIPELIAGADRNRVLFEYTTVALRNALQEALEQGGWIADPAVAAEETRRSWLDMHAHWQEFLPERTGPAAEPVKMVVAIVDHPAGAPLDRTLASLWGCPGVHRIIILNRGGEAMPYDNIDLLSAEADWIEKLLAEITEDAVLLIHSGVAILPDAFPAMLDALGRAPVDGLVPAGQITGNSGTRVVPPLGGSVPVSLLDGVTSGGALVVRRELLHRAMAGRALALEAPFLGLADFCVTRSDRLWPYPEPVVERPDSLAIPARSSLPARIAPYGETSANDRYYILAAGYEAGAQPSPRAWMRPLAYAAIGSGFGFAIRAASWGRRRLRKWMGR